MVWRKFYCHSVTSKCNRNNCVTQIKLNVFHLNCQRFEEDAVEASVMMIHTFNKDREKVKAAVDIISK